MGNAVSGVFLALTRLMPVLSCCAACKLQIRSVNVTLVAGRRSLGLSVQSAVSKLGAQLW